MAYFVSTGSGTVNKPAIVNAQDGRIVAVAASPTDAETLVAILNRETP